MQPYIRVSWLCYIFSQFLRFVGFNRRFIYVFLSQRQGDWYSCRERIRDMLFVTVFLSFGKIKICSPRFLFQLQQVFGVTSPLQPIWFHFSHKIHCSNNLMISYLICAAWLVLVQGRFFSKCSSQYLSILFWCARSPYSSNLSCIDMSHDISLWACSFHDKFDSFVQ